MAKVKLQLYENRTADLIKSSREQIKINKAKVDVLAKIGRFRGTFATEALRDSHITAPNGGDYVLVGTTAPFQEWIWDDAKSVWEQGGLNHAPAGYDDTAIRKLITGNTANITQNTNQGFTNIGGIGKNKTDIATNASSISAIRGLATSASNLANAVNTLASTANNTANTNTGHISTNTGNISTNTKHISTNTSNIASKADKSYEDNRIVIWHNQIFEFAATNSKFENSSLFYKYTISDGQAVVGGSGGGTTNGSIPNITASQSDSQLRIGDGNGYSQAPTCIDFNSVGGLAFVNSFQSSGDWARQGYRTYSKGRDAGKFIRNGSISIHSSGSMTGNSVKASGIKLIKIVYVAKRDIKAKEMR